MNPLKRVCLILLLAVSGYGKTLRYKLVTNDDGRRELVGEEIKSKDLKFLERELNLTDPSESENLPIAEERMDRHFPNDLVETTISPTEEPKLITKWNSLTEHGWNRQKNAVYVNSTKLMIYDDGNRNRSDIGERLEKRGRSENLTDDSNLDTLNVFERLYTCLDDSSSEALTKNGSINCLKTKLMDMIFRYFGRTVDGKSSREKTLVHGKKLLKGALLPLLVLLIIKYLVALPVIAAGLITIKTFWLSLLSAGVAAFGNNFKKTPSYHRHETAYDTPWGHIIQASSEGIRKNLLPVTEKYYM